VERFSCRINQTVEYILFSLGFCMTITVAVQVFFRYVLNHSLFWSEELARYLLVWLTFLGSSAAYYRKVHPGIDFIFEKMPVSLRKIAALGVHMASLILFGVMVVFGSQFAYFVRLQITPALYLPKWIVFSIIPISGIILLIHGFVFVKRDVSRSGRDD
jgi:TRAP-type C4-dicarboxylate transport system permease small subunit